LGATAPFHPARAACGSIGNEHFNFHPQAPCAEEAAEVVWNSTAAEQSCLEIATAKDCAAQAVVTTTQELSGYCYNAALLAATAAVATSFATDAAFLSLSSYYVSAYTTGEYRPSTLLAGVSQEIGMKILFYTNRRKLSFGFNRRERYSFMFLLAFETRIYPAVITPGPAFSNAPPGDCTVQFDIGYLLGWYANTIYTASVVCDTEPGFPFTDASPGNRINGAPLLIADPATTYSNQSVLQGLTGLQSGNIYRLTCRIVDSSGMRWQIVYRLICGTLH